MWSQLSSGFDVNLGLWRIFQEVWDFVGFTNLVVVDIQEKFVFCSLWYLLVTCIIDDYLPGLVNKCVVCVMHFPIILIVLYYTGETFMSSEFDILVLVLGLEFQIVPSPEILTESYWIGLLFYIFIVSSFMAWIWYFDCCGVWSFRLKF